MTAGLKPTDFPILIYEKFIDSDDCSALIELVEKDNRLQPSKTYGAKTDQIVTNNFRTSYNCVFQKAETNLVSKIEEKVSQLLHVSIDRVGPVQIIRYLKGQEFAPHYDALPHSLLQPKKGGQRLYTVLIYLNDLNEMEGGATYFPEYNIRVNPRIGRAVYFRNVLATGEMDRRSIHKGEAVLADKIKYVISIWVYQFSYSF
jgi:prolyl 4-hydroxylase